MANVIYIAPTIYKFKKLSCWFIIRCVIELPLLDKIILNCRALKTYIEEIGHLCRKVIVYCLFCYVILTMNIFLILKYTK